MIVGYRAGPCLLSGNLDHFGIAGSYMIYIRISGRIFEVVSVYVGFVIKNCGIMPDSERNSAFILCCVA
jgi:hypothetical protein